MAELSMADNEIDLDSDVSVLMADVTEAPSHPPSMRRERPHGGDKRMI